jgi:hypothetical protein
MENLIKRELLPKQVDHDAEHEAMLKHWGHTNLKANQLTFRYEGEEIYTDRFWHLALHHLYWKQMGINQEAVEKFESLFYPLEETPMPEIKEVNDLPEY